MQQGAYSSIIYLFSYIRNTFADIFTIINNLFFTADSIFIKFNNIKYDISCAFLPFCAHFPLLKLPAVPLFALFRTAPSKFASHILLSFKTQFAPINRQWNFFDSLRGRAWCGNAVYMARINLDFDMWLRFLWLPVKSLHIEELQCKQLKSTSLEIAAKSKSVGVVADLFAGSMDH